VTIIIMVAAIFLSLILLALVVVLFLFTQCRRRLGNIPPGNKELLHLTLKKEIYFFKRVDISIIAILIIIFSHKPLIINTRMPACLLLWGEKAI
jgi:hypothetical protein